MECGFLLGFIRREKAFPLRCSQYTRVAIKLKTVSTFEFFSFLLMFGKINVLLAEQIKFLFIH